MGKESAPNENDIKTVLEAHSLLPEGALLDEALGVSNCMLTESSCAPLRISRNSGQAESSPGHSIIVMVCG